MYKLLGAVCIGVISYLLFWPVSVEPIAWQAPEAPSYEDIYQSNSALASFSSLALGDQSGPEGVLVDSSNNIYVTTEQGWVLRWKEGESAAEKWVKLSGRGLGLCEGENGDIWVADAFEGVFQIKANGSVSKRLDNVDGTPLLYANDITMSPTGKIYFTDSTQRHSAKAFNSTYKASLVDILEHGTTGRVIEYDPDTEQARVILSNLAFANGIAIDKTGSFLLINETSKYRVWRYWLKGGRAGSAEVIIDNLPGFPDNIIRGQQGRFWLGFTSPRLAIVDKLADKPFLRKIVQRLPEFVRPKAKIYGHLLAISGDGDVLKNLQDPEGNYPLTTGAFETDDALYISSLIAPTLARVSKNEL